MPDGRASLPLTLRVLRYPPDALVVEAHGVVDFATAPLLRAVLLDLVGETPRVVVDLAEVRLLDGHSVGMLVAAHRQASERDTILSVRGAAGTVLRVLEISGVDKLLDPPRSDPSLAARPAEDRTTDRTIESLLRARLRQPGDEAQREGLRYLAIAQAYDLAVGLARRYRGRGEPIEDLTQVAALGAIKAVDGYQPERGGFNAYAVPTIVGEIKRYFRDKGWQIRVPRRLQEIGLELAAASEVLSQRLGHSPTVPELAAHLGVTDDQVLEAIEAAHVYRPGSLSARLGDGADGDGAELADHLGAPDDRYDMVEDWESLRPLLAALPARQRRILALRFYGNLTQSQIAEKIGVSQMHVSRLLSEALTRLRRGLAVE